MNETRGEAGASRPARITNFLPIAVIAGALLFAWASGWLDYLSLSNAIMHREALVAQVAANRGLALTFYFLAYAGLVALSFPGASLLTVMAGFLFGGIVAGLVTVFAATAGAVLIFVLARSSFGDFLQRRAGPFVARMIDGFNRDAFNYLLFLRLTPVFPFWAVNIVPALLNMRLTPYAAATFLGIIPGTFAYAFVGAGLDSLVAAQEAANPGCAAAGTCAIDPAALVTPQILAAMVALAVLAILPVIIRRWRGAQRRG